VAQLTYQHINEAKFQVLFLDMPVALHFLCPVHS
jgi:hypothetical protein